MLWVCVWGCILACMCVIHVIRLACDMPYFSVRGSVGSVLFHTPSGKWVTLEQNIPPVAARYKGEERQRWRGCLTWWPLKMTVKWLTFLTNAIMWKVCFSSIFLHPYNYLWTGYTECYILHKVRKETSNTLSPLKRLSLAAKVSYNHMKKLYENRYMYKYSTETHSTYRDNAHKYPYTQIKVLKSCIRQPTHTHTPYALAGICRPCRAQHKMEAAHSCKFFPFDNWAFA